MQRRGLALITGVVALATVACGGSGGTPGVDAPGGDPGDGGATPPAGVHVFDPAVLHDVVITVAAGDLDELDTNTDARVPCPISYDGETVAMAGIKKKGQTSQRPLSGKPGFSIKLNEFVSGQKLDGLKKLLLDNAVQDPSFLTGHLGYQVYRRAGMPAPRTAHAVVTFNGEVKGIYVVEEATNTQFLAAAYGDGLGSGSLYEGPWDFRQGPAAIRFVILAHRVHCPYWLADPRPGDAYVSAWGPVTPPGQLGERIGGVPALGAGCHAEVAGLADVARDTTDLGARIAQGDPLAHP